MPSLMTMDSTATPRGRVETRDQRHVRGDLAARAGAGRAVSAPRLLRVLVIGGEQGTTDALSRLARGWGHEVRWAYDAGVGLKVAAGFRPDLVLLDIEVPYVDGCELASQLRSDTHLKECFMIAVTGRGDEAHRQRCRAAGIDLVLVKPIDPLILESLLILESEYVTRR